MADVINVVHAVDEFGDPSTEPRALVGLSGMDDTFRKTSSLPVRAPVCELAAFEAASVCPALITIIGFFSATARAAERKERASPTDSM